MEYKDTRGNIYEIRSEAKTHWFFAPKKGEEIRVMFLQHDPQKAVVDSTFHYILLPLLFCMVGTAVVFSVFKRGWEEFKACAGHSDG